MTGGNGRDMIFSIKYAKGQWERIFGKKKKK